MLWSFLSPYLPTPKVPGRNPYQLLGFPLTALDFERTAATESGTQLHLGLKVGPPDMRHLLSLGPSTFSGQTGLSWAASEENIQEGFWWPETSADLLAMGPHGDKELFSVLGTIAHPRGQRNLSTRRPQRLRKWPQCRCSERPSLRTWVTLLSSSSISLLIRC